MSGLIGDRFRKWFAGRNRQPGDDPTGEAGGSAPEIGEVTSRVPASLEAAAVQDQKETQSIEELQVILSPCHQTDVVAPSSGTTHAPMRHAEAYERRMRMYWVTGIMGLALIVAPFVLGYTDNTAALWTSIVLGAVVLAASLFEAWDKARWEYWVAGAAGVLAVIAPFVLGFSAVTAALWASLILGVIIVLLAGYEVLAVRPKPQ
jgi:hypothetical protein